MACFAKNVRRQSMHPMLRNNASGPEIGLPGRISAGFWSRELHKSALKAGRKADFYVFPTRIRPKSSPETRFPARKHYMYICLYLYFLLFFCVCLFVCFVCCRDQRPGTCSGMRIFEPGLERPHARSVLGPPGSISDWHPMSRNSASGPEIGLPGRISAGF